MAYQTDFFQRPWKKIEPSSFAAFLCAFSVSDMYSFNDIASKYSTIMGVSVTRQTIFEKLKKSGCIHFFKQLLDHVLEMKFETCKSIEMQQFCMKYTRILIQDSTIIRLPMKLFEKFRGVKNAHSTTCQARIQVIYDLVSGKFVYFSIDPYSKNDLAATMDFKYQPGDFVLRDRGYFTKESQNLFNEIGVEMISRYKHPMTLYDASNGEEINLLKLLQKEGAVNCTITLGKGEKGKFQLIAAPVSEKIAAERRRKAKEESRSKSISKELSQLMGWSIFITTMTDYEISFETVLDLYGLRWRIENIFKTWKSHLKFSKIHDVSEEQLYVLLYSRLTMLAYTFYRIYSPYSRVIEKKHDIFVSLEKFTKYVSKNLSEVLWLHLTDPFGERLIDLFKRYCAYDIRKRKNFCQKQKEALDKINIAITCPLLN